MKRQHLEIAKGQNSHDHVLDLICLIVAAGPNLEFLGLYACLTKPPDTVGELKSAEVCGSYKPSSKAKKLGKLTQEKEVLER